MFEPVMIVPVGLLAALIIGYFAVKYRWKLTEIF